MAPTLSAEATTAPHLLSNDFKAYEAAQAATQTLPKKQTAKAKDVVAEFNYYLDPGDGSEPLPSYVGKPETYERPASVLEHTVHDIRGTEDEYGLDKTGFQIYNHVSKETAFTDEEQIKRVYYPEIEQILKDA